MKKILLASVMLVGFVSTSYAVDKIGGSCPVGYYTSQVGSDIVTCKKGAGTLSGDVGTKRIGVKVALVKNGEVVVTSEITTFDGQPVPISIESEIAYVSSAKKEGDNIVLTNGTVKEGFFMNLTPTLRKDGSISVDFYARKSELLAMNSIKQGEFEIQLPKVHNAEVQQSVILQSGVTLKLPMARYNVPVPATSWEPAKEVSVDYALQIVAEKK